MIEGNNDLKAWKGFILGYWDKAESYVPRETSRLKFALSHVGPDCIGKADWGRTEINEDLWNKAFG